MIALAILFLSMVTLLPVQVTHASTVNNTGSNQNGGGSATSDTCVVSATNKGDMILVLMSVISVNGITITFNTPSDTFSDNFLMNTGVSVKGSSSSAAANFAYASAKSTGSLTITWTYTSGPDVIGCFDLGKETISYWGISTFVGSCTSSCGSTISTGSWTLTYPPGVNTFTAGAGYAVSNTVTDGSGYTRLRSAWGWNDIQYATWSSTLTKASYSNSVAPSTWAIISVNPVGVQASSTNIGSVVQLAEQKYIPNVETTGLTINGYSSTLLSELPAAPVWVKDQTTGVIVRAGEYIFTDSSCPSSAFDSATSSYSASYSQDQFDEYFYIPSNQLPFGSCTTAWQSVDFQITLAYQSNGNIVVTEQGIGWGEANPVTIGIGSATMATSLTASNYNTAHSVTVTYPYAADLASFRYTVRHVNMEIADIVGYANSHSYISPTATTSYTNFDSSVNGFNSVAEVYQPIWGSYATSSGADHASFWGQNFVLQDASTTGTANQQPYYDCYGNVKANMYGASVTGTLGSTRFYDYLSKVCSVGLDTYITGSADDSLIPALWALHILNTGGSPTTSYTAQTYQGGIWGNQPLFGTGQSSWTPLAVAQYINNHYAIYSGSTWEGIESCVELDTFKIYCSGFASGVRTASFAALETSLCYKFGQTSECSNANMADWVLTQVQIPTTGQFTFGGTSYYRPEFAGVISVAWDPFNSVPSGGTVSKWIDNWWGMNNEYPDNAVVPGNTETTLVAIGALCQYNSIVNGVNC